MTEKAMQTLAQFNPFSNFLWAKYGITQEIFSDFRTNEKRFYYTMESNYPVMKPIQLIGYMLDYLYTIENNKVLLYMGSDIEDKFMYLVELIVKEEENK